MSHAPKILSLVFAIAVCAEASAQGTASEQIKAIAGSWEISNADRERACLVNLKPDAAAGGFKLEFDKACATVFPITRSVTAWSLASDVIRFLDAKNQTVLTVSEVESGMYEGERPGEGLYFLQSANAVGPPARSAEQMVGDWAIVRRSGRPICGLALSADAAGAGTFGLRVKPGCDAFVTRFGPSTWRMDRGELLLYSASGEAWRFEEGDPASWRRVPDSADPVLLVRR